MGLLTTIIIVLVVVAFACWLVQQIPMNETIKRIIIGIVIFLVVIWLLLQLPGIIGSMPHLHR